jgi:putative tryptophan/tyrosine transport system substrate-binding protein
MRWREFITGLASMFLLASASSAQIGDKVFRLGVLTAGNINNIRDVTVPTLAKQGFIEGRNLIIDARIGAVEELPELARAMVAQRPDAIIAVGAAIAAAKAASSTVPIVMSFSGQDPVAAGFAESLAHPGGNITGLVMLAPELDAKRLSLLHEALPEARRIAILGVRPEQGAQIAVRAVGAKMGIDLFTLYAKYPADYPAAFAEMRRQGAKAVVILSAPEFNANATTLAALAIEAGLPTVCEWRSMAERGCLLGYGPSLTELRRQTADYVVRIFKGEVASELPIEGPTHFEFVVNSNTARRLGIELSPNLLVRADEVIE